MFESEQDSGGLMASLRRLRDSFLGLLQTRAELFSVELQEEKLRVIRLVAWVSAAIAMGAAGLLVAMALLALFIWEKAGYLGLGGLAVGGLAVSAIILWRVQRSIVHGPMPFAGTVAEFKKDAATLRGEK
jgi:uncharacterized membrane protein YqjE